MLSFITRLTEPISYLIGSQASLLKPLTNRQACELLELYYSSNGLYLEHGAVEIILPEYNPTFRVVEFYAATLWPGKLDVAFPLEADDERVFEPIEQIWAWSNWAQKKQVAARQCPMQGDLFVKAAHNGTEIEDADKVYMQVIPSRNVSDVEVDHQGNIIYIRIDVPETLDDGSVQWTTEVWNKQRRDVRVWEHDRSYSTDLDELGTPATTSFDDMPVDFIPVWKAPFIDTGDVYGGAAIWPVMQKIDMLNRDACRLSRIMNRYGGPIWAVNSNQVDSQGRPMSAPHMRIDSTSALGESQTAIPVDSVIGLPGLAKLHLLIPNIKWDAYLKKVEMKLREIQQDLPEMGYWQAMEIPSAGQSGVAIERLMTPAIARCKETRGNTEPMLQRAEAGALTMAQNLQLPGFEAGKIGTYENGDFEHTYAERNVLPKSDKEKAETTKTMTEAGMNLRFAAHKMYGWDDEEMEGIVAAAGDTPAVQQQITAQTEEALNQEPILRIIESTVDKLESLGVERVLKSDQLTSVIAAELAKRQAEETGT